MSKEKSCGLVVFTKHKEGNKFLVLHHPEGHWDFSKGNVEKNEKEEQAALRELKEETGIDDVEFIDGFRETINYYYKHENDTIFKEVTFFLARSNTEHVKLSSEHIGYAWVNYEHGMKKLTFNNSKDILTKAIDFLKTVNSS